MKWFLILIIFGAPPKIGPIGFSTYAECRAEGHLLLVKDIAKPNPAGSLMRYICEDATR
jgi:hypothetical protein